MSGSTDLVDFFKLDATFDPIHAVTRENVRAAGGTRRTIVKEWKRTRRLGNGAFGTVWLEEEKQKRHLRATKEISKGTSTRVKTDYTRELVALGCLSKYRDIFVSFHGWFECENSVYFSMEYFEHGDLERFITPALTELDARIITRQLLQGLQILHEKNWTHRDLKPQNIFVVEQGPHWWVKIGDFGISKRIHGQQSRMNTRAGTPDYTAPEILYHWFSDSDYGSESGESSSYTVAVDIWSLGCVLYRLLTRQLPFSSDYKRERYYRSQIPFPTEKLTDQLISQDCIEFLLHMMRPDAYDRLTAPRALSHTWIIAAQSNRQTTRSARRDSSEGSTGDTGEPQKSCEEHTAGSSRKINSNIVDEVTISQSTAVHTLNPKNGRSDQEARDGSHDAIHLVKKPPAALPFPFLNPDQIGLQPQRIQASVKEFLRRRHTLGEEHQATLQSVHDLALAYAGLGQHEEARQLFRMTVEVRKRVLGEEHVDTLHSMHCLASGYLKLKQYDVARLLFEKTVDARKRVLGAEHADTLFSMHWFARSYYALGQYDEARLLSEKTVDARKLVLGEEHPDTLGSMNLLACCYSGLQQHEKARLLFEKTIDASKLVLGEEHIDTLWSLHSLARSYFNLKQYEKACLSFAVTVDARKRVLGEEHVDTLRSMHWLASSYLNLKRHDEARLLFEKTVDARMRVLGEEHVDALDSMNCLAVSYFNLKQYDEARLLFEKTVNARKLLLGEEHVDTLDSMHMLARIYFNLKQYEKARFLFEKTVDARKRVLGEKHIDTLCSMNWLASSYHTVVPKRFWNFPKP